MGVIAENLSRDDHADDESDFRAFRRQIQTVQGEDCERLREVKL